MEESERWAHLDRWARRHHGLITRDESGLSSSTWHRALHSGRLIQIHPGVARLPGTAITPEQRIAAAVIASGHGALASHRSASRLLGIPRPDDDPVDIIVRDRRGRLQLDGVRCHRPTDEDHLVPARRSNIACTNILRTLCDLGAVDRAAVHGALGHALTTKMVTLAAIEATLGRHARRGRAGIVALRSAIDGWSVDSRPADSVLEPAMRRLIARHSLPAVDFHARVAGWEVDFRFVGTPVIVECDGWTYHGLRRDQFERDRIRDAELISQGWVILRFSYRSITSHGATVARRIRAALVTWSSVQPPDAA
jgi:very-short-patch-repair endonuclease